MKTNFSIGDTVSVIHDTISGKIIALKKSIATIEDEHGFHYDFYLDELVVAAPHLYTHVQISTFPAPQKKKNEKTPNRIDLHIHLLTSKKNLTPSERLFLQKEALRLGLEKAREKGIRKVEIIHGIGDGIVQQMVHEVLTMEMGLEFHNKEILHHQSGGVVVYL
ncbi:Smr/MutS family protein [Bergeyella zoohelcum]|uniref:MutS2 family protein n=1 Tax=Bergeyella zoohelcum TaxID=1015 RepID=A0A7Z8YNE5_9FLAO|nr:Smr/MutS family protein [Bergeyella zoohelcum]VDH03177.1 MutS2 family protein [Bergeyella zoohelcum]